MKKIFKQLECSICAVALLLSMLVMPAQADDNIKVIMDGKEIQFDVPPQIIDDYTMVPMRAIFEVLGYTIEWKADSQSIMAINENLDRYIFMQVNNKYLTAAPYKELLKNNISKDYVAKHTYELEKTPSIVNDRTLVPIRVISELNGFNVNWNQDTKTITLNSKEAAPEYFVSADSKKNIFYDEAPTIYSFENISKTKEIRRNIDENTGFYSYWYYTTNSTPNELAQEYMDHLLNSGYVVANNNQGTIILYNHATDMLVSVEAMSNPDGVIVVFGSATNPNNTTNSTSSNTDNNDSNTNSYINAEIKKTNQEIKDIQAKIKSIKTQIQNKETEMQNVRSDRDVQIIMGGRPVQVGDPAKIQKIQEEIDSLNADLDYYEDRLDSAKQYLKELKNQ